VRFIFVAFEAVAFLAFHLRLETWLAVNTVMATSNEPVDAFPVFFIHSIHFLRKITAIRNSSFLVWSKKDSPYILRNLVFQNYSGDYKERLLRFLVYISQTGKAVQASDYVLTLVSCL